MRMWYHLLIVFAVMVFPARCGGEGESRSSLGIGRLLLLPPPSLHNILPPLIVLLPTLLPPRPHLPLSHPRLLPPISIPILHILLPLPAHHSSPLSGCRMVALAPLSAALLSTQGETRWCSGEQPPFCTRRLGTKPSSLGAMVLAMHETYQTLRYATCLYL